MTTEAIVVISISFGSFLAVLLIGAYIESNSIFDFFRLMIRWLLFYLTPFYIAIPLGHKIMSLQFENHIIEQFGFWIIALIFVSWYLFAFSKIGERFFDFLDRPIEFFLERVFSLFRFRVRSR